LMGGSSVRGKWVMVFHGHSEAPCRRHEAINTGEV
jgi:hypothetical protein